MKVTLLATWGLCFCMLASLALAAVPVADQSRARKGIQKLQREYNKWIRDTIKHPNSKCKKSNIVRRQEWYIQYSLGPRSPNVWSTVINLMLCTLGGVCQRHLVAVTSARSNACKDYHHRAQSRMYPVRVADTTTLPPPISVSRPSSTLMYVMFT